MNVSYRHISNATLLERIRESDSQAFEVLYKRYFLRLRKFLISLNLPEYTEDVIQETFITLWRKRADIDPAKSFETYLFQIAKNYALKALKSKIRDLAGVGQIAEADSCQQENAFFVEDLQNAFQKALSRLPDRPRSIYMMKRWQGMSTEEIANELGISSKTVENHMTRALTALRKDLKKLYPLAVLFLQL